MAQVTISATQTRSWCPATSGTYTLDTTNARVGMAAQKEWRSQTNYTENDNALKWRYFRSLVWFGTSPLSVIGESTVNKVSISYTSNDYGDTGTVTVRAYRTDMAFDASQEFGQTVGWYWTQGITSSIATNDHMLDYSEIAMGRSAAETAVLCLGDEAKTLVTALLAGYAVGFYLPYFESTQTSKGYGLRSFTGITLTIDYTPKDDKAYPPTEAALLRSAVTRGQEDIPLYFAGASTGDPTANYITGYLTRYADSSDGGTSYGSWSAAETHDEVTETSGTLYVTAPASAGIRRKYQIATVGATSTSVYKDVDGYLDSVEPPSITSLDKTLRYCLLTVTATLPAAPNGEYMTLALTVGDSTESVRTVPASGGTVSLRKVLTPGASTTLTVTVYDAYGVEGGSQSFTVTPVSRSVGRNYVTFGGVSSADLGLIVSAYVNPDAAPLRVENQTVIGRSGDIAVTQGEGVADAYDLSTTLYLDDLALLPFIREWLSGEGWVVFGLEPEYRFRARVDARLSFERMTQGADGYELPVSFHCQPYKYRAAEESIEYLHEGTIVNGGDAVELPLITVTSLGDGSVTVGSKTLSFTGLSGEGVIDCNALTVTRNGELFAAWSGEFPQLARGENDIGFSGQVSRITVTRRERFR